MSWKSVMYNCAAMGLCVILSASFFLPQTYAAERRYWYYTYGEFRRGYGERRAVASQQEARRMLREYFRARDLRIGDIRERVLFYEADIIDRRGVIVDKVIVDKRTGRMRSMY